MPRISLATPNFKLHKLPSGMFEVRWESGGKTHKRSTRTRDRKAAEDARAKIAAEVMHPAPPASYSVCDLLRAYENDKGKTVHSPQTLRHSIAPLLKFFDGKMPSHLRSDKVYADYRAWRASQTARTSRKPIADSTAVRELNALRGAVSWGVRNGWKGLESVRIHLPNSAATVRYRYLEPHEAKALMRGCLPHVALFVRIAIATGARMSAILELTWDRVRWAELDTDLVYFPAVEHIDGPGLDGEYIEKPVQTNPIYFDFGAGRGNKKRAQVPIINNLPLYNALRAAHEGQERKTEHVIEYRGAPLKSIATALEGAYERTGIVGATVHTLKHTCCSWLVQSGLSFHEVAAIVGTSAQTIERHYGHLSPDHLNKIGSALTF